MEAPLVSVVIPAKNAERFIAEVIHSVLAELMDLKASSELIIVDHASTDNTKSLASEACSDTLFDNDEPINGSVVTKVVSTEDGGGPARPKNDGLRMSLGEYITFLDADDLLVYGSLRRRLDFLLENTHRVAVCGQIGNLIDEFGRKITPDPSFTEWVSRSNAVNRINGHVSAQTIANHGLPGYWTILYHRSLLAHRRFDEDLLQAEDFDLAYRVAKSAEIAFLPIPCVDYRIHGGNLSVTMSADGKLVPTFTNTVMNSKARQKHDLPEWV